MTCPQLHTPYLQNVLQFVQGYQVEAQRTQAFCKKLEELNLLEPMRAQVTMDSKQVLSLAGFMGVNEDKLKALPGDKLSELAKSGELELIYVHLHSLKNFEVMKDRLSASPAGKAKDDAAKADKPNGDKAKGEKETKN